MRDFLKEPPSSEVTDEDVYLRRRELLRAGALALGTAAALGGGLLTLLGRGANGASAAADGGGKSPSPSPSPEASRAAAGRVELRATKSTEMAGGEAKTPNEMVVSYNNYYAFGLDKSDPQRFAGTLKPRPWTVAVEGEVGKPQVIDIDTLLGWFPLEERVYRMRCVEGWSMVIPWLGFPLAELVKRVEPTSRARYVAFTTLFDPAQLPGQRRPVLDWPYVEGLRIDEATHPLAFLAVGLYGKALPGQNGAPLRLVVPWKYGFKGIKSIVRIRFQEKMPRTSWNDAASDEYGFYANVNPAVDHPRWSQATERRLGEVRRRPTLPFNGYADQVASLYQGMDLAKDF